VCISFGQERLIGRRNCCRDFRRAQGLTRNAHYLLSQTNRKRRTVALFSSRFAILRLGREIATLSICRKIPSPLVRFHNNNLTRRGVAQRLELFTTRGIFHLYQKSIPLKKWRFFTTMGNFRLPSQPDARNICKDAEYEARHPARQIEPLGRHLIARERSK
jgi:hypothetical protein